MPVFNAEQFLREAVQSILDQTFSDFEFVVVNDGSTDHSRELLKHYSDSRIVLLDNASNLGIVRSLNRGLSASKGMFIARMDADDIALPDRFARQIAFLQEKPSVALVGGQVQFINEQGRVIGTDHHPVSPSDIRRSLFVHNPLTHGTVMMRRSVLGEGDVYDGQFLHNEDYDLWLRLSAKHEMANLPDVVLKRRIHGGNVTVNKETELVYYRLKTLRHAVQEYYHNPMLWLYLVRPWCAYHVRRFKS